MQKLISYSYHFELVDDDPSHLKYDFVSLGDFEVPKRVSIRNLDYDSFYNLGFGNLTINEDGMEIVDDTCRRNNKSDVDLVLNTTLLCGIHFLLSMPDAKLVFYGNTIVKHRLYMIKMASRIIELSELFTIKGGTLQDEATIDENGFKTGLSNSVIDPRKVAVEDFYVEKSRNYRFLTFEVKKDN